MREEMGGCIYIVAISPRVTTLINRHGDSDLREENHCAKTQDLNTRTFLHEYSPCIGIYVKWNVQRVSGSCIGSSEKDTDVNADVWGCHSVHRRLYVCKGVGRYDWLLVVVTCALWRTPVDLADRVRDGPWFCRRLQQRGYLCLYS